MNDLAAQAAGVGKRTRNKLAQGTTGALRTMRNLVTLYDRGPLHKWDLHTPTAAPIDP